MNLATQNTGSLPSKKDEQEAELLPIVAREGTVEVYVLLGEGTTGFPMSGALSASPSREDLTAMALGERV
jgi:hypothetical protein